MDSIVCSEYVSDARGIPITRNNYDSSTAAVELEIRVDPSLVQQCAAVPSRTVGDCPCHGCGGSGWATRERAAPSFWWQRPHRCLDLLTVWFPRPLQQRPCIPGLAQRCLFFLYKNSRLCVASSKSRSSPHSVLRASVATLLNSSCHPPSLFHRGRCSTAHPSPAHPRTTASRYGRRLWANQL